MLTADLPLARPDDIDAIIAAPLGAGPSAVLVPSADGTGTNAMLLRPPAALRPRLGPDSLARHRAQAVAARASPCTACAWSVWPSTSTPRRTWRP